MVLASADGERTVPLADYFTGYRESVRQPGELITEVVVPLPASAVTAFHKIAKRPFDDISSVAIGFALDVDGGHRRQGPDRARRRRGDADPGAGHRGRARGPALGRRDRRRRGRGAGRGGHADQRPAGQRRVPGGDAGSVAAQAVAPSRGAGRPMSSLHERPDNPVVGETMPHESAALHVTGHALYTDDLYAAQPARAARPPGAGAARPRAGHPARPGAGVRRAGRGPRADRGRRARASTTPASSTTSRCSPSEVMYYGHSVCWVLGESLEAARRGALAVEVDYEELPALVTVEEAIAAESFQGAQPVLQRGDAGAGLARATHVFEGVTTMAGQEHFYLETHASLATVDEGGQVFIQSSTQHPTETQEIIAHVLGVPSNAVTVQCLRMGGGFGGKEMQPHGLAAVAALGSHDHRPPGAGAADPRAGHDDDRQAARLPRHVEGRLRRRGPVHRARGDADRRRRLEPRPLRAGAVAGAVPHRQRLLDPRHRRARAGSRRPTRPRRPRSAASAGRRGCW